MIKYSCLCFLTMALITVIGGCPHRNGFFVPLENRIQNPEELLKAMKENQQSPDSLRSTGIVMVRKGGKRIKTHMVLLAKNPAFLRFETISFFDQPLSILVTNGMDFSLWDLDQGRFLCGPATPRNISRVVPVPLDGPEVVGIFLGRPPIIAFANSKLEWNNDRNLYQLTLSNSTQTQVMQIHPRFLMPVEIKSFSNNQLQYQATIDYQKTKNKIVTIKKIKLLMPLDDMQMEIKAKKIETNIKLDNKVFEISVPEGLKVEQLD